MFALVNAMAAPAISRLVDRLGQRRVLLPAVVLHGVWLVTFIVLTSNDAPTWTLFVTVAAAGLFEPSLGSLVRARWGHLLGAGAPAADRLLLRVGHRRGHLHRRAVARHRARDPDRGAGRADRRPRTAAGGFVRADGAARQRAARGAAHRQRRPIPAVGSRHDARFWRSCCFSAECSVASRSAPSASPTSTVMLRSPAPCSPATPEAAWSPGIIYGSFRWRWSLPRRLFVGALTMTLTIAVLPFIDQPAVLAAVPVRRRARHRPDADQRFLPGRTAGALWPAHRGTHLGDDRHRRRHRRRVTGRRSTGRRCRRPAGVHGRVRVWHPRRRDLPRRPPATARSRCGRAAVSGGTWRNWARNVQASPATGADPTVGGRGVRRRSTGRRGRA